MLAHGLGGTIAQTRPLASGLAGTRVLYAARGHGDRPLGEAPPSYALLGDDLLDVADRWGATRALGVSMGAGALLSVMAGDPGRFERAVLFLPGAVDASRRDDAAGRLRALAAAVQAQDAPTVRAHVADELPDDVGPAAEAYVRDRTAFLLASPALPALLRALPDSVPVPRRELLAGVRTRVLVLAQEGDPLHPAEVARDLAGLLPRAELVVFDRPGVVFRERRRLRELVVGFLDG